MLHTTKKFTRDNSRRWQPLLRVVVCLFINRSMMNDVMVGRMCKRNYVVTCVPECKLCSGIASGVPIPREDYKALPLVASFPGCSSSG